MNIIYIYNESIYWVKYRINYKVRFDEFTYNLLSRRKMVKEQIRFVEKYDNRNLSWMPLIIYTV